MRPQTIPTYHEVEWNGGTVYGIPGFLFEFKHTNDAHMDLASLAEKALHQIDEKKYDTDLRDTGVNSIIKIGIAFRGKSAVVRRA